jgi:hypothetical protein
MDVDCAAKTSFIAFSNNCAIACLALLGRKFGLIEDLSALTYNALRREIAFA